MNRSIDSAPASTGALPEACGASGSAETCELILIRTDRVTHLTARAMAKAVGMGVATVQKIWKALGLAPYRWRAFKLYTEAPPAGTEGTAR